MLPFFKENIHEKFTSSYKHWSSESEQFAGGDHLLSALRTGWQLDDPMVAVQQYWKSGSRPVTVYHFVLSRDDEVIIMPIINNPFIERFISEQALTLVYDDDSKKEVIGD